MKEIIAETKQRMRKTVEDLTMDLATIRTGRASVHLLDQVSVYYYGNPTPVNQLATLHAPEPSLITVQPYDTSQIEQIEKAILTADLGLNPYNDGRLIRIPIPALTQERRETLAKQVGKIAEGHRTAIRNIRRDVNDKLKELLKTKELSEDLEHTGLDQVQEITDQRIKEIDQLAKQKEKETRRGLESLSLGTGLRRPVPKLKLSVCNQDGCGHNGCPQSIFLPYSGLSDVGCSDDST